MLTETSGIQVLLYKFSLEECHLCKQPAIFQQILLTLALLVTDFVKLQFEHEQLFGFFFFFYQVILFLRQQMHPSCL